MAEDDAIDEDDLILCCAVCCANVTLYPVIDCFGCSGNVGVCCCNLECCCKRNAPCLFPCACFGLGLECDGCSIVDAQCHCCCFVTSAAIPCNKEVPLAVSVVGLTLYPKPGCCVKMGEIMDRD